MRSATVRATRSIDRVLVGERLDRRGLGEGVAEERLAHLVERPRQLLRAAQREADAQPAEAVDLGEGAQQHEVGVALEQLDRGVGVLEQVELAVGLVDDHAHVRRDLGEEVGDARQRQRGARGVVRVADDHQARRDRDLRAASPRRSWRSAPSSATVTARAPEAALRCG